MPPRMCRQGKVVFVTSKTGSEDGKPISDFFGLDGKATEAQARS